MSTNIHCSSSYNNERGLNFVVTEGLRGFSYMEQRTSGKVVKITIPILVEFLVHSVS